MRNDNAAAHRTGTLFDNIIGNSLGCPSDRVIVHPVRTCRDNAAQAGGAEGKILAEALTDLMIVILNRFQLRIERIVLGKILHPLLISGVVIRTVICHTITSVYDM